MVGPEVEIVLDGGVRRGIDIVKGLARGADSVAVGRAYLYGLAAGGYAGVDKARVAESCSITQRSMQHAAQHAPRCISHCLAPLSHRGVGRMHALHTPARALRVHCASTARAPHAHITYPYTTSR